MPVPLLTTKLYLPRPRPDLVPRPQLVERLNQGLHTRLTLLSAPAGFGKSTLIAAWAKDAGVPVGWVSLDEGDNDPARFAAYFIGALQRVWPGFGASATALLAAAQPPPLEALLTGLLNEIAALPQAFVLVLDDFHLITDRQIHEAVTFILDHQPGQMHLFIASRADPPSPLARWRARGEMTELRARDLRFTTAEAAVFLNGVMRLGLSADEVDALETRTEGWIAGLQMAALSMQGREDRAEFIRAFAGGHRFIFDYLIEEVLAQQPADVQTFLLKTSLLERMTPSLCDAVSGRADSQTLLTQLEQANLFLLPLDDRRQWYRYHHLFADLLQQSLKQSHQEEIPKLHRKACEWYQRSGLIHEAIYHGMLGGDVEQAANLIEGHIFTAMEQRELVMLKRWLGGLPSELIQFRPWLGVAYAWVLAENRECDAAERHLQHSEGSLGNLRQVEKEHISSYIASIRAECRVAAGDMDGAISYARSALSLLPEKEKKLSSVIASLLGTSLQRSGAFEEAAKAFMDGISASQAVGDLNAVIDIYGDLVGLYVERGLLPRAYSLCQEALRYVEDSFRQQGRYPLGAGHIHFRLSTITRHWNDLEGSLYHAKRSSEILQSWGLQYRLNWINLAIALQAVGDNSGAAQALERAEETASRQSAFWIEDLKATRALIWLAQGDLESASTWALESGLDVDDEMNYKNQLLYRTLAQVYLVQGQNGVEEALDQALRLSSKLLTLIEESGAAAYLIQVLILQALAWHAKGELESALPSLEQALAFGESGGYVRVFVREGAPMGELLRQALTRGTAVDYAGKLLAALNDPEKNESAAISPLSALVEPLSTRELEVLRLLTTHLTTPEMAAELTIAPSTIRTHVKSIYRKLNARSRIAAVKRAREMGLI